MRLGVRIQYYLLVGSCWLVGLLPRWLLYHVILDVIYFLLYWVVGYRLKVVRQNLAESFPEKSARELRTIERRFYYHLSEIFIDTVDIVGISKKSFARRVRFTNIEEQEARTMGINWICAMAHYGSWEYFTSYQMKTDHQVVGVYHKLHNEAFDRFYYYERSRFGLLPVSMRELTRFVIEHRKTERNYAYGLIADQNPSGYEIEHWFDFLNHKTAFLPGIEKLALKFDMPVYFLRLKKIGRARYEAHFELLYDGTENVEPFEITERYVRYLENMIRERPEYWMWSHRRWKRTPPEGV